VELKAQSHHLAEVNTALKVLLRQREDDKKELADNVLSNVKELIGQSIAADGSAIVMVKDQDRRDPRDRCRHT
jgi:hypothetical protein